MNHINIPDLVEKLQQDLPLRAIERIFLIQILERLWGTDELDHMTNPPKTH
jgi:hypothetical protein